MFILKNYCSFSNIISSFPHLAIVLFLWTIKAVRSQNFVRQKNDAFFCLDLNDAHLYFYILDRFKETDNQFYCFNFTTVITRKQWNMKTTLKQYLSVFDGVTKQIILPDTYEVALFVKLVCLHCTCVLWLLNFLK